MSNNRLWAGVCLVVCAGNAASAGELEALKLKLPYAAGTTFPCNQGFHGQLSHSDGYSDFALDFGLPEGTPVLASAAGRVLIVKEDSTRGGPGSEMSNRSNYVWIDHGSGRFTVYEHLKFDSVRVRAGELVNAGQWIASSGNTGKSTGPHLHFGVTNLNRRTVPCRFVDVAGDGIPVIGRSYTSGNDGAGMSWFTEDTRLPLDAFARDGVALTTSNIAVHFEQERAYVFRGSLSGRQRNVRLFFSYYANPPAVAGRAYAVAEDGTFRIEFRLAEFAPLRLADALFQYAITPEDPDGNYRSSQMVTLTRWRDEVDPRGEPAVRLGLPFGRDQTHSYTRSSVDADHTGAVAIAIFMPEKAPVFACAAGRVIAFGFERERDREAGERRTRFVTIDHGDGVLTDYLGLALSSVQLRLGEIVQGGERIGSSFRSSLAGEANLGLRVRAVGAAARRLYFEDVDNGRFEASGEAQSTEAGSQTHVFRGDSLVDPDAFASNGVRAVSGLPLSTFHVDTRYTLEAVIDPPAEEVVFVIRRRGENRTASTLVGPAVEGKVCCELVLARTEEELVRGPWEWTLTTSKTRPELTSAAWFPLTLMR